MQYYMRTFQLCMTKQSELVVELYGIRVFEILEFQNFARLNYNHDAFGQLLDEVGRYRLPTILSPDISAREILARTSQGHFGTCMFRPCRCTGTWTFCLCERLDTRNFWHHGHRIFWNLNISAHGYFDTLQRNDVCSVKKDTKCCSVLLLVLLILLVSFFMERILWTFQHRNFGTCAIVPKCPFAKMSLCQNFPVSKIPRAKKSPS